MMKTNIYTVEVERRYASGATTWEKIPGCSLKHAKSYMTLVGAEFAGGVIHSVEYYRTEEK